MVSKNVFYQLHRRLIEIFNFPNLLFTGRSILVVGDFHQLPPFCAIPVYASSLDEIIYIKFDYINAGKRSIQTDNLSRHNSWVPIKRIDTHINTGNSFISALIQRTQFTLTLAWACTNS